MEVTILLANFCWKIYQIVKVKICENIRQHDHEGSKPILSRNTNNTISRIYPYVPFQSKNSRSRPIFNWFLLATK